MITKTAFDTAYPEYIFGYYRHWLTHWGRMTHICVSKLTIIGSDNGLSPGRRQAIIWTNDGILSIGPSGTNFSEILVEIFVFSFKNMQLKPGNGGHFVSASICYTSDDNNPLAPGRFVWKFSSNFQANSSGWWPCYILWDCPQINVIGPYWRCYHWFRGWVGAVRHIVDLNLCRH